MYVWERSIHTTIATLSLMAIRYGVAATEASPMFTFHPNVASMFEQPEPWSAGFRVSPGAFYRLEKASQQPLEWNL